MERKTNNSILVPTDFSEVADRAVEHAVHVAKAYGNDITLLYVMEEGLFSGLFAGSQSAMIEDAMKIKLDQQAKELAERSSITINTRVAKGSVYKTIAQIANAEAFDSIIMGSHGASGFKYQMTLETTVCDLKLKNNVLSHISKANYLLEFFWGVPPSILKVFGD
jgi:nucleotide-binding universal stress UspA family protein